MLVPHVLTEENEHLLDGFECGDDPWAKNAQKWILGPPRKLSVEDGNRIWVFTRESFTIGFGSLGETKNWLPEQTISFIPMVAVRASCHNQGYGKQIVRFLLDEAVKMPYSHVGLFVDSRNEAAIHIYIELGFIEIDRIDRSFGTLVRMIARLR